MTKRQIKEVSVKKDNCINILYLLLLEMSCLKTFPSGKNSFFFFPSLISDI